MPGNSKYDMDASMYYKNKPPDKNKRNSFGKTPKMSTGTANKEAVTTAQPKPGKSGKKEGTPNQGSHPQFNKSSNIPNKANPLNPKLIEKFSHNATGKAEGSRKRKDSERSPNSQQSQANLPASKSSRNYKLTDIESSIEGSTDSLLLSEQDMNSMWENYASEKEKQEISEVLKQVIPQRYQREQDHKEKSTEIETENGSECKQNKKAGTRDTFEGKSINSKVIINIHENPDNSDCKAGPTAHIMGRLEADNDGNLSLTDAILAKPTILEKKHNTRKKNTKHRASA